MSLARGSLNAGHYYSNIGKPFKIDLAFTVTPTNGLGVTSLKSNGYVRNVFMHTSTTPASNDGYTNPNPASGYVLIQLKQNFNAYLGFLDSVESPVTGAAINISGTSVLTAGVPYQITSVGATPAAKFTVLAVADSSGNSAGKYFAVTDVFSNNYLFYNVVSGTGTPPSLTGALAGYTAIPVAYSTNAANTAVATAIANAVAAVNGTASFTTSVSTATVTVTNAGSASLQFPLAPNAQTSGFTVSAVTYTTLAADWQSVGLPPGLAPAVGQSFIATATGSAKGTGQVKALSVSGISGMEVLGDPNQSIANSSIAANGGAWLCFQFLAPTNSSTTTQIPTAPAAGTIVNMSLFFDGTNVTVDGL